MRMISFEEPRLKAFSEAPAVQVKRIARGLCSEVALVSPQVHGRPARTRPFIVDPHHA